MFNKIKNGQTYLGIEFGSTRIKAVLTDNEFCCISVGSYDWKNKFEDGYWTYSLDEIHKGLQGCYANLAENVADKYGVELNSVGAMGISGMMHGYLAFDENDNLLVPFRTWRNTTTEKAANELTELFGFNIPQRWSIAHLYQAILNKETHVTKIAHITTLAGYIHFLLTGRRELGVGEASGMFPVSHDAYDRCMLEKFKKHIANREFQWNICDILPTVRKAGDKGAYLTEDGARLLDPTGKLKAGIPICPPEGDAGTGMVATNAILPRTGNVSAGTSIFAMLVLEKELKNSHKEIDIVTTPEGTPVAMIHCNNCCGELDAWVEMFGEFAEIVGVSLGKTDLYELLYKNTAVADADCGGITAFNYLSGEHLTGVGKGRPMCFRSAQGNMNLANFVQAQIYSSMATLALGMEILFKKEAVCVDQIRAHGGLFKVKGIAQQILANALQTGISVTETAGEGGAWGMSLLAAYMMADDGISLGDWLSRTVFAKTQSTDIAPNEEGIRGFKEYLKRYKTALAAEKKLEEVVC